MTRKFLLLLCVCGCESAAVETTTRQMDSASDVALLCAVETRNEDGTSSWAGTTMDKCAKDADPDGTLFAFVVQRYRGELAAVNLRDRRLLDLDLRQPLSSPVVVGPLPNAIAAAPDGSSLAVANLGDPRPGDDPTNPDGVPFLSVVNPANLLPRISLDAGRPFLSRVPLPVPASNVAYLDSTHVVVTLPDLSAVAVVTLGESPVVGPPVVLEPFPLLDGEGNPLPGLAVPWSILIDDVRGRLLVGDRAAPWLAVLTWDDAFALTVAGLAPDPYQLPGPAIAMALEPAGWGPAGDEAGRWIYAVDGRSRGVMVLDAETLTTIDMSTGDPLEWRNELIVPGLAQDVLIGRIEQDPAPTEAEPAVMHGTFGFVVSSFGEVYAVDVEDHGNAACWDGAAAGEGNYVETACPRHVLRNGIAGAEGPRWSGEPPAFFQAGGAVLSYTGTPPDEYPRFADFGGETPEGDPTYGVLFDAEHPRRAVSQTWIVEYEGVLPWTDGNGGQVGEVGWFRDRAMPFCARGVLAGDILIIKDGPDPLDETADCSAWGAVGQETELEYRIADAYADRLLLETVVGADGNEDPLPAPDCFPWAVRYEVRVGGQWLVRGESTGFQHHVTVGEDPDPTNDVPGLCVEAPDDAICTPYENCTTEPVDVRCLHDGRATQGLVYKNPFLCFTMNGGTSVSERGMRWELDATGGFAALSVETGALPVAEALDLTTETGPALLVVDSSSDGLIRVDLQDFTVSDNWP
ncbi:MAG: hypothetical protein HY905_03155 [Deltaproteobacteria bacterium]|nr:hypothetical protein [Deltaproteobacteria bacterium]